MSEVNTILGFNISDDEYETELESGWVATSSPFGICTARGVFNVVFWKGSDADLNEM